MAAITSHENQGSLMLKNLVKAHVGQRPFSIPSPFTRLTEEFPGHTESARWKANVLTMQYHFFGQNRTTNKMIIKQPTLGFNKWWLSSITAFAMHSYP